MSTLPSGLELWGGVECTLNRVDDSFFDQLTRSGHLDHYAEHLELFASLGLRTLRTAIHWERFEAHRSWALWDSLLARMEQLRLRPILGLLHHGSGPPSTDLLDPQFPQKLAAFALQVAERYPHITDYTPVNEPQTTGRFACLYGHWYPHHRSMASYLSALIHELKGIALSMAAIRTVQPEARLIHTEDAGATFATPRLEAFRVQREHRRWLGTDLLCGLVTRDHPLFAFLLRNGLAESEILWFSDHPCPPSVLGLNYYVTSDRFLDHRVELYPGCEGGDMGDEPLVDVDAVRIHPGGITGIGAILTQAWERYRLPVAMTEAHLGCHPIEQTRWLAECWLQAEAARARGVDIRAVTVWALLGSYNWCHLCTHDSGAYEPGVYDLSTGTPTATALTELVYRLAQGLPIDPSATKPGWWRHPSRLTIPPIVETSDDAAEVQAV